MLTKYNLKMPHAVYGGENAMDNIHTADSVWEFFVKFL